MKLELTILSTTLLLVTLSYPVFAGTSFTGLRDKITVLDLDAEKKKSDEQQRKAQEMRQEGASVYTGSIVLDTRKDSLSGK